MIKSIADVFNSKDAIINDPLREIHTPVQPVIVEPLEYEYDDFLSDLDYSLYPYPTKEIYHRTVDPMHGRLKSVYNK